MVKRTENAWREVLLPVAHTNVSPCGFFFDPLLPLAKQVVQGNFIVSKPV